MSLTPADHVEIVRRAFVGFQQLDLDAFTADWAPEIVWDLSGYDNWDGSKTVYQGAPEILDEFATYMGRIRGFGASDLEVVPLDDGRVLSTHRERRRNPGETEVIRLDIGAIYTFKDARITRVEVHTGHSKARSAAGLD
jgi:ketosteroid isomerase-like protein